MLSIHFPAAFILKIKNNKDQFNAIIFKYFYIEGGKAVLDRCTYLEYDINTRVRYQRRNITIFWKYPQPKLIVVLFSLQMKG